LCTGYCELAKLDWIVLGMPLERKWHLKIRLLQKSRDILVQNYLSRTVMNLRSALFVSLKPSLFPLCRCYSRCRMAFSTVLSSRNSIVYSWNGWLWFETRRG
jgi:hypothetical protein